MQLILKERRVARLGSLKVLDFATTRCTPACERWVDLTGLKQLFAIFMGKSKVLPNRPPAINPAGLPCCLCSVANDTDMCAARVQKTVFDVVYCPGLSGSLLSTCRGACR